MRAAVKGYGYYLPARIVTNDELAGSIDTNDEWIVERTGIKQRHIAGEGEFTSHLGAKAAINALKNAGLEPNDIDMLILATTTPDDTMPATATKIQQQIGMTRGSAFDVNAACSGFVYAMTIADSFIKSGAAKRILVVGAETFSRILDWKDRSTCILFGDGAAALVLEASQEEDKGVLFAKIYSDGNHHAILNTSGGVSSTGTAGYVSMNGKEVFRHAVSKMSDSVLEALASLNLDVAAIDKLIPHQANVRILQAVGKRIGLPEEKLVSTVAYNANTSSASIPLAIAYAADKGQINPGDLLVMPALGAGLTWGTCIIRW